MHPHEALILQMFTYEKGCPKRIQHFLKVLAFSEQIAHMEGLDEATLHILRTAAVVHDIGIRPSLEKYNSSAGSHQQIEGPPVARPMLETLGYAPDVIDRVCYLIAHHHTYHDIDGVDYQILVEADFLVNIFEGDMAAPARENVRKTIFQTEAGKQLFDCLYP